MLIFYSYRYKLLILAGNPACKNRFYTGEIKKLSSVGVMIT